MLNQLLLKLLSFNEVVIGTGDNGKPYYARLFETPILTTSEYIVLNITNQKVLFVFGWIINSNGTVLPYGSYISTSSGRTSRAFSDGTNVKVQQAIEYQNNDYRARVLIIYQKTTD